MTEQRDLLHRHAYALVDEALSDTRVVTINGARQAGKSTIARLIAAAHPGSRTRLLDDPPTLRAAREDSVSFVDHDGLLVVDEAQLAPELFRTIKMTVDLDPRPGQFLLTGSARVLSLRDLPDALPGRMEIIELWPLSQGEIDGDPDLFVDAAFAHGARLDHTSGLRRRDYLDRVVRGGFPEAVRRAARRRTAFHDGYLTTLIERDVKELSDIEHRGQLRRLLAQLAGRAGSLLVPASLANESGLPRTTLIRYLELLAMVFLIKEIPGWSTNQTRRAVAASKLAFVDSGLASHLLGQTASRLGEPDGGAGPLMENFVLMELSRQLSWNEERASLFHYRTRDQIEVDGVVETADGRVIGIEVKAGATIRTEDLRGLRHLRDRLGSRFVAGYLLYTGQQTLPFGDRLRAMPIEALWKLAP